MSDSNDKYEKVNTDSFIAIVGSIGTNPREWVVLPQIREMDGSNFKPISVAAGNGITPAIGDKVLILTMRNNLDFEIISRYFSASASNGVIIAIIDSVLFELTGSYKITGNLDVTEKTKLGDGSQKMVRGNDLKDFCQEVLDALTTIKNWATSTAAPPGGGPLTPPLVLTVPTFPASVLSTTNTLE